MLFLGRKTKRDQTTKRRAEEKVYIWVLLARPQPMTAPPRTPPVGGPGEPLTCGGAGGVQRLRPPAKPPPRGWAGGGLWLLATLKGAFCKEIMRVYGYPTTSSTGTHTHGEMQDLPASCGEFSVCPSNEYLGGSRSGKLPTAKGPAL